MSYNMFDMLKTKAQLNNKRFIELKHSHSDPTSGVTKEWLDKNKATVSYSKYKNYFTETIKW